MAPTHAPRCFPSCPLATLLCVKSSNSDQFLLTKGLGKLAAGQMRAASAQVVDQGCMVDGVPGEDFPG